MFRTCDSARENRTTKIFIVFDVIMSLGAVCRWSKRVENKPATSAVGEFFDNRFPDSRMEKIFANMEFGK